VDLTKLFHLKGARYSRPARQRGVQTRISSNRSTISTPTSNCVPRNTPATGGAGITCYYAGKFDEGKKQFEGYEQVDTNDVENAVWRYLCMAKSVGVEKARAQILKIGRDKRKPMMEVYALFAARRLLTT